MRTLRQHRRTLRPGELSTRFRRVRHESLREAVDTYFWDLECEHRANMRRYDDADHEPQVFGEDGFNVPRPLIKALTGLTGQLMPLNFLGAQPGLASLASPHPAAPLQQTTPGIEAAVLQHIARLPALTPADLWPSSALERLALHRIVSEWFEGDAAALWPLLLFSPFWRRSLRGWQPRPREAPYQSLLRHLLVVWPVPSSMVSAMTVTARSAKWMVVFVVLSGGGSLRRLTRMASDHFWPAPKRMTAHLAQIPALPTLAEGLMFAEVLRLGGDAWIYEALCSNDWFRMNPLDRSESTAEERTFWEQTILWLVHNRRNLQDVRTDMPLILEWSLDRFTRVEGNGPGFTWSGRTPQSARRDARADQEERDVWGDHLPSRKLVWARKGWDWADGEWRLFELNSTRSLHAESNRMHHCVRGYDRRCADGTSAIFSLQRSGLPTLTVEVDLISKQIVQALGVCNRRATQEEEDVLARWRQAVSP